MIHRKIQLEKKQADGYICSLGPVNLVWAVTEVGLVACGAFDVAALDRFNYPAVRLKPTRGNAIASLEDLLSGEVKEVNMKAGELGIKPGDSGKEALLKM